MNSLSLRIVINDRHALTIEGDPETFRDLLVYAAQNAAQLRAACETHQGTTSAPHAAAPTGAASAPHAAPNPAPPAGERGPVGISGIVTTDKDKNGKIMNAPKHTVTFTDGKKFSTFDAGIAQSAKTLWVEGKTVYYTTSMNGTYENLASVRSAQGMP